MNEKKRIVLIGNNKGMETLCDFFLPRTEISVAALIHSDKPGSEETARKYAEQYGITHLHHPSRKDHIEYDDFLRKISGLGADLAICYSYDRIFDEPFLNAFCWEVYNLHGAMLPRYRGQNVLNWVLVNGETDTGITLHKVDLGIDSGPIVRQKQIMIAFEDTAVTLKRKMDSAAMDLLEAFLPDIINGSISTQAQDESQATYFHKRHPSDGEIDWNRPAVEIYNLIRALVSPWPGAYYYLDDRKYIIDCFIKLEDVIALKEQINQRNRDESKRAEK